MPAAAHLDDPAAAPLAPIRVTLEWRHTGPDFPFGVFSPSHLVCYPGEKRVDVGDPARPPPLPHGVAPEAAQLARVAAHHMLHWLRLAALIGAKVESYRDEAEGRLASGPDGRTHLVEITLDPRVLFSRAPTNGGAARRLHELVHERWFDPRVFPLRVVIRGLVEPPATLVSAEAARLPRRRRKSRRRRQTALSCAR